MGMSEDYNPLIAEIDFVKSLRVIEAGWTMVNYIKLATGDLTHYDAWKWYDPQAKVVFKWCEETCEGDWHEAAGKFYFEKDGDAMMFTLRWAK